jgi:hypothetical protein
MDEDNDLLATYDDGFISGVERIEKLERKIATLEEQVADLQRQMRAVLPDKSDDI